MACDGKSTAAEGDRRRVVPLPEQLEQQVADVCVGLAEALGCGFGVGSFSGLDYGELGVEEGAATATAVSAGAGEQVKGAEWRRAV